MTLFKKNFFYLILLLVCLPVSAKQYYRYKNSKGQMVVIDQVNNEMILTGYAILNNHGRVIKRVKPGKTLAQEEKSRQDKVEEEKANNMLKRKLRGDAELLRQFSSLGDVIRNRDVQLFGLAQRVYIQSNKLEILKIQLVSQQRQAANQERSGSKVTKLLQKDILDTRNQIQNNKNATHLLQEQQVIVAKRYEGDIVRYKKLKSKRKKHRQDSIVIAEPRVAVYQCRSVADCNSAWKLAEEYAKEHATGKIELSNESVILTSKAEKIDDITLSFSRIPITKRKQQILLDIRCTASQFGAANCKREAVKSLAADYVSHAKKQAQ